MEDMKLGFLIQTKYLGPTNHRGARIKAWFPDRPEWGSVTESREYEIDAVIQQEQTAKKLAKKICRTVYADIHFARSEFFAQASTPNGLAFIVSFI